MYTVYVKDILTTLLCSVLCATIYGSPLVPLLNLPKTIIIWLNFLAVSRALPRVSVQRLIEKLMGKLMVLIFFVFQTEKGQRLELTFDDMDVEESAANGACRDEVEVRYYNLGVEQGST